MHHQNAALSGGFIYLFELKPLNSTTGLLERRAQENHCLAIAGKLSSQECPPQSFFLIPFPVDRHLSAAVGHQHWSAAAK